MDALAYCINSSRPEKAGLLGQAFVRNKDLIYTFLVSESKHFLQLPFSSACLHPCDSSSRRNIYAFQLTPDLSLQEVSRPGGKMPRNPFLCRIALLSQHVWK